MFTDGSQRDGGTGSGISGIQTTVFQAEVFHIMKSAEILRGPKCHQYEMSLLLHDCCIALKRLSTQNRGHLIWVPRADELENPVPV